MENKIICKKCEKEIKTEYSCGCVGGKISYPNEKKEVSEFYGAEVQFSYTVLESLLGLPPDSLKEVYVDNRCDRIIFKLKTNQPDHFYINRNLIKLYEIVDGMYYYRHEA